jgi:hypothetical protein
MTICNLTKLWVRFDKVLWKPLLTCLESATEPALEHNDEVFTTAFDLQSWNLFVSFRKDVVDVKISMPSQPLLWRFYCEQVMTTSMLTLKFLMHKEEHYRYHFGRIWICTSYHRAISVSYMEVKVTIYVFNNKVHRKV